MIYPTSLDKRAIFFTVVITVLFAFIIVMQYPVITDHGADGGLYTTVTCLLIYFFAFAFRPLCYAITPDEIVVKRPLLNVHIKRSDVTHAEVIDNNTIHGAIRTFGVGGLFGYYGDFYCYKLGSMKWYATRTDKVVLLHTNRKNIIITPDNPEKFVADLNQ